ncbi:MAG: cytochrome c oxidase subunit 3 [Vicinamibacterales bacterium]|nr:cytochrome c oxidase subunit 3 [Vicinamibacterales bacterium]
MSVAIVFDREVAERWHLREVGVWMFLGTVVMLFAAFTSAYVVRKSGADWVPVHLPPLLWLNSVVLLASSLTLELGRRPGATARAASTAIAATCGLALLFFAGQVQAWSTLARTGVYLPTNPASSFFYILTGVHGAHLIVAFGFLAYLFVRTVRRTDVAGWPYLAGLVSTVWHFLTAVWIYLLLMLRLA